MRATTLAVASLLMIGLIALPPAVETFTGIETPEIAMDAAAVVCHEDIPGGCCDTVVHDLLNINC